MIAIEHEVVGPVEEHVVKFEFSEPLEVLDGISYGGGRIVLMLKLYLKEVFGLFGVEEDPAYVAFLLRVYPDHIVDTLDK